MKKYLICLFISALLCFTIACGKSDAAKALDEKIQGIGTVTLESGALITEIENDYISLPDKEKKQLEYYQSFVVAKESYDKLVEEKRAEEEAKKAAEEEAKRAAEQAQNELVSEIEDCIKNNKSSEALKKLDLLEDEGKKAELQKKFKDKCYKDSDKVFRFGEVVSTKPNKTDEQNRSENYYYFNSKRDIENAFDEYNAYLFDNFEFKESSNAFGKKYQYRGVELFMFTVDVDGVWLLQVKY